MSLQPALSQAAAGDTVILVSNGAKAGGADYLGNFSIGSSGTSASSPVTIDGSEAADATLSGGNGAGPCGPPNPPGHCFGPVLTVTNNMNLTLKDVSISGGENILSTAGNTQCTSNCAVGGGLQNANGGAVTITDSTFAGNFSDYGGAIFNGKNGGSIAISNSTFTGNTDVTTGAIANLALVSGGSAGDVFVTDSTFADNNNGAEIETGLTGHLTVNNSTFVQGSGGPDIRGGNVTVLADVFANSCTQGGPWTDWGYNAGVDGSCFNGGAGDVNAGTEWRCNWSRWRPMVGRRRPSRSGRAAPPRGSSRLGRTSS